MSGMFGLSLKRSGWMKLGWHFQAKVTHLEIIEPKLFEIKVEQTGQTIFKFY